MKKKKIQGRLAEENPDLQDAPTSAIKQEGVTSSFSTATTTGASYGGEDIDSDPDLESDDQDKTASASNDEPAGTTP